MAMLAGEKAMYGRVRLGGTFGWGLIAPLAGIIIQSYGLRWAFWGYAAIMFLAFIVSQKFTFKMGVENVSLRGNIRQLLTNRRWVFFLCLAFVGGVAFTSINSYLFPYMEELGASRSTMGIALDHLHHRRTTDTFLCQPPAQALRSVRIAWVGNDRDWSATFTLCLAQFSGWDINLSAAQRNDLPNGVGGWGFVRGRECPTGDESHRTRATGSDGIRLRVSHGWDW